MSSVDNIVAEARKMCCASCGKSELDDIKLKECDGCDLVRYCSDTCREDHRSEHEAKCKERATELREKILASKMSSADNNNIEAVAQMMWCASCGKSGVYDVKLKPCDGCDLVYYCSVICQEDHRSEHDAKCKERVAKLLREEILFRQPECYLGDCPICLLPLPLEEEKKAYYDCCSTMVCMGCVNAHMMLSRAERREDVCAFCRADVNSDEDRNKKLMKRIQANDSEACNEMGAMRIDEGNYEEAFNYFSKAVELGNIVAHHRLSLMYMKGQYVEKDEKKELYHEEEAAIGGLPAARYNLAMNEGRKGREDRAVKHLIIAANIGHDLSLQTLKELYKRGLVSKDDFAAALRAHKAAADERKSPQRDAADKTIAVMCALGI